MPFLTDAISVKQLDTEIPVSDRSLDSGRDQLSHRVRRFLNSRGIEGLDELEIEAEQGVVILRGRLSSDSDHRLCQRCTHHVAGVLRVVDQISSDDE